MIDLKRFRKDNKLTQQDIADLFGCLTSNISMMEKSGRITDIQLSTLHSTYGKELVDQYINEYSIKPINKIPYYDIDFMAGTSEIFNDGKETPSHYIDIKPFDDCNFALPIFGDSMFPIYQNGDIVMCREVIDKSIIPLGEAYLIVTPEHRLLKYLKKGPAKGVLLAVSENSEQYDPFEIPIDHIKRLYIVKGVIKRKTI